MRGLQADVWIIQVCILHLQVEVVYTNTITENGNYLLKSHACQALWFILNVDFIACCVHCAFPVPRIHKTENLKPVKFPFLRPQYSIIINGFHDSASFQLSNMWFSYGVTPVVIQ